MSEIIDHFEDQEEKEKMWAHFIGARYQFYIDKWRKIEEGKLLSFNIGAFFFGAFWMLYRKMYLAHIIWVVFLIIVGVFQQFLRASYHINDDSEIQLLVNIIFAFILGFIANWIYYIDSQRKIKNILNKHVNKEDAELELEKAGGSSFRVVILGILIYMFLFFLLGNLLMMQ